MLLNPRESPLERMDSRQKRGQSHAPAERFGSFIGPKNTDHSFRIDARAKAGRSAHMSSHSVLENYRDNPYLNPRDDEINQ